MGQTTNLTPPLAVRILKTVHTGPGLETWRLHDIHTDLPADIAADLVARGVAEYCLTERRAEQPRPPRTATKTHRPIP